MLEGNAGFLFFWPCKDEALLLSKVRAVVGIRTTRSSDWRSTSPKVLAMGEGSLGGKGSRSEDESRSRGGFIRSLDQNCVGNTW